MPPEDDARLSRIETQWSVVRNAHDGSTTAVRGAQQALINRYGGAIQRYLLASLRDQDAADEVYQEFSLKFVGGGLKAANPDRGRFRNFIKSVLYNLTMDYHRRKSRGPKMAQYTVEEHADAEAELGEELDAAFEKSWRDDLLARCWQQLDRIEQTTGKLLHTVLKFRVDHPDLRSGELATKLSAQIGKPLAAGNVRVMIHRARDKFAELLLDEVAHSLESDSLNEVEQELIDLNLLSYCRPALEKRGYYDSQSSSEE